MQSFATRIDSLLNSLSRCCLKQPSIAADASSTIIAPHALAVPGARLQRHRDGLPSMQAISHFRESRSLRYFFESANRYPRGTCPPWQRELSGRCAAHLVRCELESSLTCYEHTFMWSACQRIAQVH